MGQADLVLQSMNQRNDPRQYHRAKPHRLDPRDRTIVDPRPVRTSHQEQPVDNRVVPAGKVTVLPFFEGTDGIRPEGIIVMDLVQRIFVPGPQSLRVFAIRTQRPGDNLGGYHQQSKHLR